MKRVVIESPLGAASRDLINDNKVYACQCMRDCLRRNEAPYASHLLFDQVGILDDQIPAEREQGIKAGFAWGEAAEAVIFYVDKGISRGMLAGFERALTTDADVMVRSLETGEELYVPVDIGFPTTEFEEEAKRRNIASFIETARVVTGRDVSVVAYEPERRRQRKTAP
jgi:hypothetical protein